MIFNIFEKYVVLFCRPDYSAYKKRRYYTEYDVCAYIEYCKLSEIVLSLLYV